MNRRDEKGLKQGYWEEKEILTCISEDNKDIDIYLSVGYYLNDKKTGVWVDTYNGLISSIKSMKNGLEHGKCSDYIINHDQSNIINLYNTEFGVMKGMRIVYGYDELINTITYRDFIF